MCCLFQITEREIRMHLYVGTYTQESGIVDFLFDEETGALTPLGVVAEGPNAAWIAPNADASVFYVGQEVDRGQIASYRRDADTGKLELLNVVDSRGSSPCYVNLTPDGKHVLVANYSTGTVAIFPVQADGSLAEASDTVQQQGSSIVADRQGEAHAHMIAPSPDGGWVLVTDLGADKVVAYRIDSEAGTFGVGEGQRTESSVTPGAGPRHFAYSPDGTTIYVINELDSTLSSYTWNADSGSLAHRQTVPSIPSDFTDVNYPSQVQVSIDGRYVYGSNRLHDSIAIWSVAPETGELALVANTSTGAWPRNFSQSPDGRWLIVANQNGNTLQVFARNSDDGSLTLVQEPVSVPAPAVVTFI
jgi:6-phosphogluconolactonase